MTDFNPNLHPKDRRGRWRDALARALGPDPLGTGAASGLLRPPHRTGSTPSAEVAALRHLRPGQTTVLPHGTRVTRPLGDLQDPREFHVEVPRSTVARREEAVANGVPDLAPRNAPTPGRPDNLYGPDLAVLHDGDSVTSLRVRGSDVSEIRWRGRERAASRTHSFGSRDEARAFVAARERGHAASREASPGRVTPHNASLGREYAEADRQHREALHGHGDVAAAKARRDAAAAAIDGSLTTNATRAVSASMASPGRAGPPRTRPRTVVEMTRRDAGLVAKEIGRLKMYGDGPSPPRDFFGQLARSGDPGERMKLRLGDSTYGVARDAIADAMEHRRTEDVARIARALGSAGQESPVEMSPGRVRRPPLTREERAARVRAAQGGPRPEPVGDIFTAINGAIETLRKRREATASPGRAQPEPNFPEGGVSIVSGGYRMGPYGTWEQAADQLLRERRSGSKSAHARAGLVADRDLSPEQARHLVELAARRALAVQEAARRDREQLAAIILRG